MKNVKQFILTIVFLIPLFCYGQEMIYNNNKISYEGKVYNKNSINSIMMASPEAYRLYSESINSSRKIRDFAIGGALATALTVFCISQYKKSLKSDPLLSLIIAPVSFALIAISGVTSISLFTVALSHRQMSNRRLKEAVNHYNWEIHQNKEQDLSYLKLDISNHGLSLNYSF
jgi:hypothetical protein